MSRTIRVGTAWILLGIWLVASAVLAQQKPQGSKLFPEIFDDDWTPPTRVEPKPPATKPVTPTPSTNPPTTPRDVTPAVPPVAPSPIARPPVAPPVGPALLDIPAAARQTNSRKLMRELFATQLSDKSLVGRKKLLETLTTEAEKVRDNAVDRYVLLSAVLQAAREVSNLPALSAAADQLASTYKVDALAVKADVAGTMNFKADVPTATAENLKAGLALIDELLADDDFVGAAKVAQAMQPASLTDAATRIALTQRSNEAAARRATFERVQLAVTRLAVAPDDPAALLTVGSYQCFNKGNWPVGLPMLARCANPLLKAAAIADQQATATGGEEAAGDAWWTASEREVASSSQAAMKSRSAGWYRVALASGKVTGLARMRLEKRLESLPAETTQPVWISRNAAYTVSSQFKLANYKPSPRLLNGLGGGYQNNEFAFHSDFEQEPHIVIDLGNSHRLLSLEIVNRKNSATDRAKTLTAWTSNAAGGPWVEAWRAQTSEPQWTVKFDRPISARYVKLGLRERTALHLFSVKVFAEASALTAVAAPGPQGGVLLYGKNERLLPLLDQIGKGPTRVIERPEAAATLSAPNVYAGVRVVVINMNFWRDTPVADLSDAALASLKKHVADGGDLILFEQFAMGNMVFFERTFGINTGGGGSAVEIDPGLAKKFAEARLTTDWVPSVPFYNRFNKLPQGSTVLAGGKSGEAFIALAPFGKGRLILFGTATDSGDVLNTLVLYHLYDLKIPFDNAPLRMDDRAAKVTGVWVPSRHDPKYIGFNYLQDKNEEKGSKSVTFSIKIPRAGDYEVRCSYLSGAERSASVPITISGHSKGQVEVRLDQKQRPSIDERFASLGTFTFEAGSTAVVEISNSGTEGVVIADAVELVPVK